MLAKTHILVSFGFGVTVYPAVARGDYTLEQYGFLMAGLLIGALLPDIDHPHSLISQFIPLIGTVVSRLGSHRGFFHSLLGTFVVWWLIKFPVGYAVGVSSSLNPVHLGAGLIIGYVLHIAADMLTVRGVRLFYPLRWNIGLPLIRTGSLLEIAVQIALIVFVVSRLLSYATI